MSKTPMHIVKLEAENVKRLKAVAIRPSGAVVKVGGKNGQGKSSTLDAIMYALGGKGLQAPEVIRRGEDKARVTLDLGDLVVERRWTRKDSYIEVRSKDGAVYKSPQAMLDKLVGALSFDPLEFLRLDPKKQLAVVRQLVGVDTSKLDQERAALFDQRTQVNREVATAKARFDLIPEVEAPDAELSMDSLLAEQRQLREEQGRVHSKRSEVGRREAMLGERRTQTEQAHARVAELQRQLAAAVQHAAACDEALQRESAEVAALRAEADSLVMPDGAVIEEKLKSFEATNKAVRQKKARAASLGEYQRLADKADGLTERIAALDQQRQDLIAAAKFPVNGLGFGEDGITLNGLPIEQASQAERLRLSIAMGLALNPQLKVILIRDGALLDEDSLALVERMAADSGAQVWLEVVGKAGDVSVLIEDGEASGPDVEQPAPGAAAEA
jgi:hypothetical protein